VREVKKVFPCLLYARRSTHHKALFSFSRGDEKLYVDESVSLQIHNNASSIIFPKFIILKKWFLSTLERRVHCTWDDDKGSSRNTEQSILNTIVNTLIACSLSRLQG
jgi:hypothetical protein